MQKLTQQISRWIQQSDKKLIIGISGHGAAGKTTFANRLMEEISVDINYLNTDPYIVSSSIRKHAFIDYTYNGRFHHYKMTACHPAAHQVLALERDIQMLRENMDLRTMDTHYSKSKILSSKNKLTIVEGMSVAFTDPEQFDLLIYFYTDDDTEFARRSKRDIEERGSDMDYLKQSHNERRIQYEIFMHPYNKNFDIIVKSTEEMVCVEKSEFDFQPRS